MILIPTFAASANVYETVIGSKKSGAGLSQFAGFDALHMAMKMTVLA